VAKRKAPATSPWQNRITGTDWVPPDQLQPHPLNPRFHTRKQEAALVDVLTEVGLVQDVIVNQRTGYILDGHLRVQAALSNDVPLLPVKYVDLSEDEELVVLATFDPLAALAAWDKERAAETIEGARKTVQPGTALDGWLQELSIRHSPTPAFEPPVPAPADEDAGDDFLAEPVSDAPVEEDESAGREVFVLYVTAQQRNQLEERSVAIAERLGLATMADAVVYAVDALYETLPPEGRA